MNTITTTSGITEENTFFDGFTDEERDAASEYIERVAGVRDVFDQVWDEGWDIVAGVRSEMTTIDIFGAYATHKRYAEEWIDAAYALDFPAFGASESFSTYASRELQQASDALRSLAGHALREITGTRRG